VRRFFVFRRPRARGPQELNGASLPSVKMTPLPPLISALQTIVSPEPTKDEYIK
jgi:hypothetical protein